MVHCDTEVCEYLAKLFCSHGISVTIRHNSIVYAQNVMSTDMHELIYIYNTAVALDRRLLILMTHDYSFIHSYRCNKSKRRTRA